MTAPSQEPARQRRRGAELEAALLQAAWDELAAVGFATLTMESVAARAHTGIAVLYRRWTNKDELVLAAIDHYRDTHPVKLPDTDSLRDDLLGLLTSFSNARASFIAVAAAGAFSGLPALAGLSPAQARTRLLGAHTGLDEILFQRAHDRGDIDLNRIPTDVLALPLDLARHDLLMTFMPLTPARIRAIVDELFLPLLDQYQSAPGAT